MFEKFNNNKTLVTGGTGMVGSALKELIPNAIFLSSKYWDLRVIDDCEAIFGAHKPNYVIHLAAHVGGIKANSSLMGEFYRDNMLINTNVLEIARKIKVEKLISLMSTCVYPNNATYPLLEEQLHEGSPHESNFGYAFAKRMLDVQSRSYRRQFGSNFITAIPNNIVGINDNFDLENSHVVPAIIRKIYEAKLNNEHVELWSGEAIREFTFSKDIAKAILFLMQSYDGEHPINIGNTEEISIREIAWLVSQFLGYSDEKIRWNNSNLGQLRKPSSNQKFLDLGWKKEWYTDIEDALRETCNWFTSRYPFVRGVKS